MRALRNIVSALIIVVGLTALIGAIWVGLPILGSDLLAGVPARLGVIGAVCVAITAAAVVRARARRRAADALETNLLRGGAGDGAILAERMQDAVAQLKQSGGQAALYDLPWYVLIGPPGAGKTTALLHSGLEFPGSEPEGIAGFGGTRNCDFWFARDAVLIDTAGRYTTQDSDTAADKASWSAFLDQLKSARPDQPINGVILTLSCADLMTAGPEGLEQHAATARARLDELTKALKVKVPVYVMFTKADMVAGFRDYFGSFDEVRRKVVWGTTFQRKKGPADIAAEVGATFHDLISRLTDEVTDRMAEELDSATRIAVFGFPSRMAMLEPAVATYLGHVFSGAQARSKTLLRGFYFTSGMQEGSPIDQVLGTYAAPPGGPGLTAAFMSGQGRSYFLHDLLAKVVFAERSWAGFDRGRMLRRSIVRGAALLTIAALFAVGAGAVGYSYWTHASLVRAAEQQTTVYASRAQRVLSERRIDNAATRPLLPALAAVRVLPAGYAGVTPDAGLPDLGLSRVDTIRGVAVDAYSMALEQMLRPRMMLLAERRLVQALTERDEAEAYAALKVYILLAKEQDGRDDDLAIQSYFAGAWADEYATLGSDADYRAVNAHLAAMLALDDRVSPWIKPDRALVDRAREDLANMDLADRVFGAMEAEASALPPVRLAANMPGLLARDGRPPDTLAVPGFYTFDGYWRVFLDMLARLETRVMAEAWVLGRASVADWDRAAVRDAVSQRYAVGFEQAWQTMLDRVSGTSAQSALPLLVEEVVGQTDLSRGLATPEAIEIIKKFGEVQGVGAAAAEAALRRSADAVQAPFAPWFALARGPLADRPIDRLVRALEEVAADPARWPDVARQVGPVPDAVGRVMGQSGVPGAQAALARNVTAMCQQRITPFYPFAPAGSAPLPMADFAAFFGYGGQVDRFWSTYGAVEGAARLPVSDDVRADFQAVEGLRAALFPGRASVPDLPVRLIMAEVPDGVTRVDLDVGQGLQSLGPDAEGVVVRWPSEVNGVGLVLNAGLPAERRARVPGGAWALVSLLRGAQDVRVTGNRVEMRLQIGDVPLRLVILAEGRDDMPLMSSVWRDFVCPARLE
ncbi:type VI secretion system membrane subunit TssM [Tateyamaria sp. ANG-S1]|uniref:type VI secretion system membrane subunit TssM n=1 Tax=Tateyamaria sp. ANG-S1 TaxID=1577905 RepID=UPI00057E715E|nr:type VI secretion system membrane subunit TssM [Tateyamaria sp. ANG-S1]KIC47762.1 hypothetical protein RA29_19330 [Tateyamaria sp. ANG-S1]